MVLTCAVSILTLLAEFTLNFAELEFATFSSLMAEIRRIAGVTDVRTVPWMPSEREHLALSALLVAMPEPVLSLDTKGRVELANPASCLLFAKAAKLRNHPVAQLIADFNVQRWLESSPQETHAEHVVVNGQNYLLEVTPVYLEGEHNERVLTGAVAMLRSTVRMGRQLQTMTSQIPALSVRSSRWGRKCATWWSKRASWRCSARRC